MGIAVAIANTLTRPANTTPYAAGQLVGGGPLTFALVGVGQRNGYAIEALQLRKSSNVATLASFNLHLFNIAKTVVADQGAITGLGNMLGYIGTIPADMASGAQAGLNGTADLVKNFSGFTRMFDGLRTGQLSIFGYLEATAAYVPVASEQFTATLQINI